MPELLKGRKKPTVAGKKRIQITLNLTKAKLSCLPSFTKHSTVKKLSYERENFSPPASPGARPATQPTSTKIAACQRCLRSCTSWKEQAKEAQESAPRPPFHTIRF